MKIRYRIMAAASASFLSPMADAQATAPTPGSTPSVTSPRPFVFPRRTTLNPVSLIWGTARPASASDQYRRISAFAQCAARVSPTLSQRLLAADPASAKAAALSRQLIGISKGCVSAGSFVPTTFFRSALAEMLYRGENHAPLAFAVRPASVATVAECVFVQSPASVDVLLRTAPGSDREQLALDGLVPLGRNCIAGGKPVDLTGVGPFLRAGLAEVAYRNTATAKAPRT